MPTVRTHYDDLGISRDASAAQIAAAFDAKVSTLEAQRQAGDTSAEMLLGMLRGSFAELSNPQRRAEHDSWIACMEADPPPAVKRVRPPRRAPVSTLPARQPLAAKLRYQVRTWWSRHGQATISIAAMLAVLWVGTHWWPTVSAKLLELRGDNQVGVVRPYGFDGKKIGYVRPPTAPNGRPWPTASGYVDGYPRERFGGYADIEADNSQGTTDVFARLVWLDGQQERVIRQIYLQRQQRFAMEKLPTGRYVLKYLLLESGQIEKTDPIEITITKDKGGSETWNGWTVGLYGVIDGTDHRESISEKEFFR